MRRAVGPLESPGESPSCLFQHLVAPLIPWLTAASFHSWPPFSHGHLPSSLHVCSLLLLGTPVRVRVHPNTVKEIKPEYSLEGLMLKLKHQLFGKDPDAGKD